MFIIPEYFAIPHITFEVTLKTQHTLNRRQFPLTPAYATTFNSCQGLTLDKIRIDATHPVFSHGQLYTALLQVRWREDLVVYAKTDEIKNITFDASELLL